MVSDRSTQIRSVSGDEVSYLFTYVQSSHIVPLLDVILDTIAEGRHRVTNGDPSFKKLTVAVKKMTLQMYS